MTITYELDLNSFKAWSGAKSTLERIQNEGKCRELENALEELYPDGMGETELNDLLWFEPDFVFELVGLRSESQIREEISNKEDEISDKQDEMQAVKDDFEDEVDEINSNRERAGMNELDDKERALLWKKNYADDFDSLEEELKELKEELEELEEELNDL